MKPAPEFEAAVNAADALELDSPRRRGMRRQPRRAVLIAMVLLAALAGGYLWLRQGTSEVARYTTVEALRGELVVTVSATGTLQPTNQVDVGSELSGTVQAVLVDDNSVVRKGDELARLDVSRLQDQIRNSRAALEVAQAAVLQAQASQAEAQANVGRLREVFALSGGKVPSRAELEAAEATRKRAEAGVAGAQASVSQARATLSTNETNLAKASIRSPIDGVVLARKVQPGQTVAASLQAPVLFTLAQDLRRMELQVKVDEADVGQVRDGQQASFTVDAYPGRRYPATIRRVAFGASTTDNVVSYLTILTLDNEDLSLRPGMTATAEIIADRRADVLLVPNAALRFSPPREGKRESSLVASLLPRMPRADKQVREVAARGGARRLWVLRDGQPAALEVRVGATNGRMTEIEGDAVQPGMQVITGLAAEPR